MVDSMDATRLRTTVEGRVQMLRTSYAELADARIHSIEVNAKLSTTREVDEARSRVQRWTRAVEDDASALADLLTTGGA